MELTGKIGYYMENPHSADERKKEVSQQIKAIRKKAGLTQKEVCEIIKVTPQTYSGYETGKYEPTMETIVRLSILYDVSTDHLLCNWIDTDDEGKSYTNNETDNEQIEYLKVEIELMKEEMIEMKKMLKQK